MRCAAWALASKGWALLSQAWAYLGPIWNSPLASLIAILVLLYLLIKDARAGVLSMRWWRGKSATRQLPAPQSQRTTADRIHLFAHRIGVVFAGILLIITGIPVALRMGDASMDDILITAAIVSAL